MASPLFATPATTTTHAHTQKRKRDDTDTDTSRPQPGRTMKRWRNGRPREEDVYQYTLSKLFSAQSSCGAPQSARTPAVSSSPAPPKMAPTRVQQQPRNAFAAMAHTKPSVGGTGKVLVVGVVGCEDCDRRIELTGFGGDDEGRCGGCARRVCDGGCSIERDGGRVCLECAMRG